MKKLLIPVLAGLGLCLAQISATAQEFTHHTSEKFTVPNAATGVLAIYNIAGSIKVEGYNGNQVLIEVDEKITSKSQEDLESVKSEYKLGFDQKGDSIICYTVAPYDSRPRINNNRRDSRRYTIKLEYSVKVPFNMNLRVGTVNDGNVSVKDVYGALKVSNVNGALSILNAKGKTDATTVNGDVVVTYAAVPQDDSRYHTINGKLDVSFPENLSADLAFKSMNGQYYTNFPDVQAIPSKVMVTETKNSNGATYKLNKNSLVRIGSGGKTFSFETLNGNIYIKKI
jgi:hypothetical protein